MLYNDSSYHTEINFKITVAVTFNNDIYLVDYKLDKKANVKSKTKRTIKSIWDFQWLFHPTKMKIKIDGEFYDELPDLLREEYYFGNAKHDSLFKQFKLQSGLYKCDLKMIFKSHFDGEHTEYDEDMEFSNFAKIY